MAKIVYVEYRESRELDIVGVYENENIAYRIRELREYELKGEGYDTDDDVRVWIEDVNIVYDNKPMAIWCLNGYDDEGNWEVELFFTYEKARKSFESYIDEYNMCYGKYDEEKGECEPVCEVGNNFAEYNCGSHYGAFWISEVEVR